MSPAEAGKIFISYAKEDVVAATSLRDDLERHGYKPWLDTHELIGGQRWEPAIRKALRESDLILLVLSERAVNKRGYVQREIRIALDLWEEKLESDIFLIPVRLEPCSVPDRLRPFQWIDLFEASGLGRLHQAVSIALGKAADPNTAILPYALESVLTQAASTTGHDTTVVYPRMVVSGDFADVDRINSVFAGSVLPVLEEFLNEHARRTAMPALIEDPGIPSVLQINWRGTLQTPSLLSVRLDFYRYLSGGAHGGAWFEHLNFALAPLRRLSIVDLFSQPEAGLAFLRDWSKHEIAKQSLADFGEFLDLDWIERGTSRPESFGFNLGDRGLILYFGEYEVGPYSWGIRQVEVPYAALSKFSPVVGAYAEFLWSRGVAK